MTNKIGLALSGGGARGLAHIGVLAMLEQEEIVVDCLAGTSMGGVIAAAYAAGMGPDLLEREALRMASARRRLALVDLSRPRRGLFEGEKVHKYLADLLGDRTFDDLQLPLTLVAVDLNTGREVHLNQGRVADAVRATIAIPGLFAPVERDGQLLVDGGLLNNLPTDVARGMGADVVIAVATFSDGQAEPDLMQDLRRRRYIPDGLVDTADVLWRSIGMMAKEISRFRLAETQPQYIIKPVSPPGVTVLTGFSRAAEIIAAGNEATIEALPRIQSLLASTVALQVDE